jgi:hypothetical protein
MAMISEMLSTMPAVKVGKVRTMEISGSGAVWGSNRARMTGSVFQIPLNLNQGKLNSHHSINI